MHLNEDIINKLVLDIKGRFLAPKDNLCMKGDNCESFFIVRSGLLVKFLVAENN